MASRDEISKDIVDILKGVLCYDEVEITEDSNIAEDLDLSSLELYQALAQVEEKFGVKVSDSQLRAVVKVSDLVEIVANPEKAAADEGEVSE